jgi:hypothetical protein
MPKKTLQIKKFEGGINSYSSPRDIPDNTLVDAEGISVDKKGIIRCSGEKEVYQFPDKTKVQSPSYTNIEPGYGAFHFQSEHSNPSSEDELCLIGSYGVGFVNQTTTGNVQDIPTTGGFTENDGTVLTATTGSSTVPLRIHDTNTADEEEKGRWSLQNSDGDNVQADDDGWTYDTSNFFIDGEITSTVSGKLAFFNIKKVIIDKGLQWYEGLTIQFRYYLDVATAGDGLQAWAHRGKFQETEDDLSLARTADGAYTEYITFTKHSNGNVGFRLPGEVASHHKIMWVSAKLIPGEISNSYIAYQNWQSTNIYSFKDKAWKSHAVNAQITNIEPTEAGVSSYKHGKEAKPVFTAEEGILRICDGELKNSYVNNRWYGAIDRSLFGWRDTDIVAAASQINTNHYGTIKEWHDGDAYIYPPTTTTHATLSSTELITEQTNREFHTATGNDWALYETSGTESSFDVHSTTSGKLNFNPTTTLEAQGVQLPVANIGTLYVGKTYRISLKLDDLSGEQNNLRVGLGGTLSDPFHINTTETLYHFDLKIINTTGALLIYGTNISNNNWTIDDVSIKEILIRDYHPGKVSIDAQEEDSATALGVSTDGLGIHLGIDDDIGINDVAGWVSSKGYHFYVSYLYDGEAGDISSKQESDLLKLNSSAYFAQGATAVSNKEHTLVMAVTSKFYDSTEFLYLFNKRVTGARVYFEDLDEGNGIYNSLLDIDFEKGCRKAGDLVWTPWAMEGSAGEAYLAVSECPAGSASATASATTSFVFEEPFPEGGESLYEMNTGYKPQDMFFKYKTTTRVGKRMYIGNIAEMTGTYKSRVKIINNDKIIFSPQNKFDLFPSIENSLWQGNDGDEIIALQGFQDYLLIFKRKRLILILVDDDNGKHEQVGEYSFYGVDHVDATVKTDFGVAWANNNGCYLFDGEEVLDLTKEKISSNIWNTFVSSINDDGKAIVSCNYLPNKKQLIIFKNPKDTQALSYICDLETKSWIKAPNSGSTKSRTNIFNDEHGALCWFENKVDSSIISVVPHTTYDTSGATDPDVNAVPSVPPHCTITFGANSSSNSSTFINFLKNIAKVSKFKIAMARYNYNTMGSFTIDTDGTTDNGSGTTTGDDLVSWITMDSITNVHPTNIFLLDFSQNTTTDNETSGGSDSLPDIDNSIANFTEKIIQRINEGQATHKWQASQVNNYGIKLTYNGATSRYADNTSGQNATTDSGYPSLKVPVFIFYSDVEGSNDYYYLFFNGEEYTLNNDADGDKSALSAFLGMTESSSNSNANALHKIKGIPCTQGQEATKQVTEVSVQGVPNGVALTTLSTPLSLSVGSEVINYVANEDLLAQGYYEGANDTFDTTVDSNQDVAVALRMKAQYELSNDYTVGDRVYDAEENDIAGADIYYFTIEGQQGVPFNVIGSQASTTAELQMFSNRLKDKNHSGIRFLTKNFDFGDPSVRKKIYKVYVTFRSMDKDEDYSSSYLTARYMVNGEDSANAKEFSSSNSVNYQSFQGFVSHENTKNIPTTTITDTAFAHNVSPSQIDLADVNSLDKGDIIKVNNELLLVKKDGINYETGVVQVLRGYQSTQPSSGDVAIGTTVYIFKKNSKYVAELKPSTSINNIYSFQLLFESTAGTPSFFEIDDITIVYRMKNVK